jgi:hypothetical protein
MCKYQLNFNTSCTFFEGMCNSNLWVAFFPKNVQLEHTICIFPKKCATRTYKLYFFPRNMQLKHTSCIFFQEMCNSHIRVVVFFRNVQMTINLWKWFVLYMSTWFSFFVLIHMIFILVIHACLEKKKFARTYSGNHVAPYGLLQASMSILFDRPLLASYKQIQNTTREAARTNTMRTIDWDTRISQSTAP